MASAYRELSTSSSVQLPSISLSRASSSESSTCAGASRPAALAAGARAPPSWPVAPGTRVDTVGSATGLRRIAFCTFVVIALAQRELPPLPAPACRTPSTFE